MDIILWLLVAAVVVWELFAHFVARNREAHTLSNRIWWMEKRFPKSRGVVVVACLVLLTHLAFHVP